MSSHKSVKRRGKTLHWQYLCIILYEITSNLVLQWHHLIYIIIICFGPVAFNTNKDIVIVIVTIVIILKACIFNKNINWYSEMNELKGNQHFWKAKGCISLSSIWNKRRKSWRYDNRLRDMSVTTFSYFELTFGLCKSVDQQPCLHVSKSQYVFPSMHCHILNCHWRG